MYIGMLIYTDEILTLKIEGDRLIIYDKLGRWGGVAKHEVSSFIQEVKDAMETSKGVVVAWGERWEIPVDKVRTLYNILLRAADKMGVDMMAARERGEGIDRSRMMPIDVEDL